VVFTLRRPFFAVAGGRLEAGARALCIEAIEAKEAKEAKEACLPAKTPEMPENST